MAKRKKSTPLRFAVLEHGAESLVQGYLMRRNILTYQAPRKNEGYDLICIHPDPRKKVRRVIRVQVKSRYQTDCDRSVIVPRKSRDAFDFVVAVFLNVGYFYKTEGLNREEREPEFFTLPAKWVEQHRSKGSSWGKLSLKQGGIERFKGDKGFELIADALGIDYPARLRQTISRRTNDQRPMTNDQRL
jgi:hypothetical protein